MEQAHPEWVTSDSPTQRITTVSAAKRPEQMLSLKNALNMDELKTWANKVLKEYPGTIFLPEEKLEKVRAKLGVAGQSFPAGASEPVPAATGGMDDDQEDDDADAVTVPRPAAPVAAPPSAPSIALAALVEKIAALEGEVAALRSRLDALESALGN